MVLEKVVTERENKNKRMQRNNGEFSLRRKTENQMRKGNLEMWKANNLTSV